MKAMLHESLRDARAGVLDKLDGLTDYEMRQPMTPTGTNLLGVVKHLGGMEYGYLSETFGRTIPEPIPGDDDLENNGDMWAKPTESRDDIINWYRRACALADETIATLDLNAPGSVPHWPEDQRVTTLGAMILRVLGEELSHGGQMAIVRELVDGRAGTNHPDFGDADRWSQYVAQVQAAADAFADDP